MRNCWQAEFQKKKKRIDYFVEIEVFSLCTLLTYEYINEDYFCRKKELCHLYLAVVCLHLYSDAA